MPARQASSKAGSDNDTVKMSDSNVTAGALFNKCLRPTSDTGAWFTLSDCAYRYLLTVVALYWCLLTSPIAFTIYTFKHSMLWYGKFQGFVIFLSLPVMPLMIVVIELFKKVKNLFEEDWTMQGPGRVFFIKPDSIVGSFLWSCYINQSMYVGQFLLVGTDDDAIQHTWQDVILTKDFWRSRLESVNARLPRELGRWTGSEYEKFYDVGTSDLVVKIPDSYLGIGDSFWNHGKDFTTEEDLKKLLASTSMYEGKEAMVLELVRPRKCLGVHSLDIITMRTPDDDVKAISVLLWTDCTTDSSHSCQAGYTLDVETETVVSAAAWYSPAFTKMETPLVGTTMPGVKRAVEMAVAAHKKVEEKWLTAVGWDCMIMEKEVVFFEGNFAGARTPRRMFLNFGAMKEFIVNYFWPFGKGCSSRPGIQAYGK